MEIRYKQDINHNYMILKKTDGNKAPLAEKMLLHNNIPGLLKLSVQYLNGEAFYYYDIRSRQAINVLFEGRNMSAAELKNLLAGLVKTADRMNDYLLQSTDILVKPQCIFWNLESGEPVFCCYPEAGEDYTDGYMELAQFLIDVVDKTDEEAAKAAYDYFNQVCDGIYSPENIIKRMGAGEEELKDNTVYEDPLPVESLWDDEEDHGAEINIIQKNDDNTEEETHKNERERKPWLKILLAGLAVIVLMIAGYTLFFPDMDTDRLIRAGGIVAAGVTAVVTGVIYVRRRREKQDEDIYEDFLQASDEDKTFGRSDDLEQEEYSAFQERMQSMENAGETVLLSDYAPGNTLAGRKIKTNIARLSGSVNGREENFEIDKSPFTIGKMAGKADAVIADRRVSRIHAAIRKDGGRYYISDLNSTNGTCLNDRRLEQDEAAALEDGDIIKFANVMLKFSVV